MFKDTPAFASFSTNDIQKAKAFYGTTLGIAIEEYMPGMLTLKTKGAGDVNIFLKQQHIAATFTVLNFVVDDIAACIEALTSKGISFEQYAGDEAIFTDEQGIAEFGGAKAAWFKDTAGNLLQLLQMPKQ
jgi:predicted enzyme related to lactoylglutathione lyase